MSKSPATVARLVNAVLLVTILAAATGAEAQTHHRRERGSSSSESDRPAPAVPVDKRDSVVTAPGPYMGRPYWLALAQCGGIYFKLNVLYTDIAVHARVVKPDPDAQHRIHQEAQRRDQDRDGLLLRGRAHS